MPSRALVALPLLLALLLAACGGDPEDEANPAVTAALARAAYVDRADRICEGARSDLLEAAKSSFGGLGPGEQPSRATVSAFVDRRVTPVVRGALDKLGRLHPPAGDRPRIDAILAAAQRASRELAADPSLVVERARDPFLAANRRARAYGFRSCGSINPSALACAVSDAACGGSRDARPPE